MPLIYKDGVAANTHPMNVMEVPDDFIDPSHRAIATRSNSLPCRGAPSLNHAQTV